MSNITTEKVWVTKQAKALGISDVKLRRLLSGYDDLKDRMDGRDYCESCGVKVRDDSDEGFLELEYISDEEGMTFCRECANQLMEDHANSIGETGNE